MLWKPFAVGMVICFGLGMAINAHDILELASLPIDGLASGGLLAYAFRLRQAHTHLWTTFASFFAAWSLICLVVGSIRGSMNGLPFYAIIGGSLIAVALMYLNWLALKRLGRAEYA